MPELETEPPYFVTVRCDAVKVEEEPGRVAVTGDHTVCYWDLDSARHHADDAVSSPWVRKATVWERSDEGRGRLGVVRLHSTRNEEWRRRRQERVERERQAAFAGATLRERLSELAE